MEEEIIVQTADDVATIDYRMKTNDMVSQQAEEMQANIDMIAEQLDVIIDNTNNTVSSVSSEYIETGDIDLSEVTDLIENIDTTLVEANTQDILVKLNNQQEQINNINEKLDLILDKL